MRTRRGVCNPTLVEDEMKMKKVMSQKRKMCPATGKVMVCRKRTKTYPVISRPDMLDNLPDDLVLSILSKLICTATCPSDFINVLITCKRLNGLGLQSQVLNKASPATFPVKAESWSESSHRFLKLLADAGNVEACYTLGMIRFYCLQSQGSGASLMAKAGIGGHAPALYSLAVIQFNGSGGSKNDKDLRAGVALCARAAFLGHIDALRELGHCLQDGYGVRQNITEGQRFLVQANARELAWVLSKSVNSGKKITSLLTWTPLPHPHVHPHPELGHLTGSGCPLLSDFGFHVQASGRVDNGSGLRLCSHVGCGRLETRKHEFRRCSVCGAVNYCSRACQALDWKLRHKAECAAVERWVDEDGYVAEEGDGAVNEDDGDDVIDES